MCCIDFNNHTNEEINESILLPTINTVKSQLSINSENYKSIDELDEPISSITEQIEESFNTTTQLINGIYSII